MVSLSTLTVTAYFAEMYMSDSFAVQTNTGLVHYKEEE